MKFASYALNKDLLGALTSLHYVETTKVQESTLAKTLKGNSLICKAETGSGKTHAYLIPAINNLDLNSNSIQCVILEPTIELCNQCEKFAKAISNITNNFNVVTSSNELTNITLPTILVSTPGKLADVMNQKKSLFSQVNIVVLDEADMLLEGEASQETIAVVDKLNPKQILVFTATMKEHQLASLKKLFGINEVIDVNRKSYTSQNVKHHFVDIKHRPLDEALELFLKVEQPYFTLVFASKKTQIKKIYDSLCLKGIKCALLTSDISLNERKNVIRRISEGEYELVLCSDLASRGLDFEKVSHVISLDIPQNIDYYYHRSGRTGRYKDKGDSYIFFDDDLNKKAKQTLESKLEFDYLILRNEGLKADKKKNPQPKKKNEALEAEIQKELAKVRSNKVKPNYKKKMRLAVEKAKKNHKRKIIMENLKSKRKAMAQVD